MFVYASEKAGRRMRDRQLQGQDMPYEKFLRFGAENLTESELLAIILRTGTRDQSAVELAAQVLALTRYPREGILGLYDLSLEELMKVKGIGMVKAVKLKSLTELSMRISRASAKEGLRFDRSSTVADYFMEKLRHRDTECVILVCLDAKGQMIREKKLSDGSVRMAAASPREIFIEALQCHAVSFILIHNHPSGDPTPSSTDRKLTRTLRELGEKMEIPLLDHIIIGDNRYISFRELQFL
ncbi:MAG: DNA repair protein RadC [Candidatus Gastranaerophilales bacterium]|nr:DNA repair protein RadC [Candidatus Gastranaerophilales bacterium]